MLINMPSQGQQNVLPSWGGGGTISFVLFPRASEPSMNFNISKMVY